MAAVAPALTYKSDVMPAVEVYWSALPVGSDTITVYRTVDGERQVVRNASAVAASGSFAVIDYEAPFGVPVTYSADTWSAGIPDGTSATSVITLNVTDIWIHDPLNLENVITVSTSGNSAISPYVLAMESFNSLTRTSLMNKSLVIGRTKPVVQFYGRKALEGLTLDIYADLNSFGEFNGLLDVQPLLIRTPLSLRYLPRALYASITAVEEPVDFYSTQTTGLSRFKLTVDEVEGQSLTVYVNLYTYSQYSAKYALYNDANAVYGSFDYTYVSRNPLL